MLLAAAVVVNHLTVLPLGLSAVLLFFVLSGYWVADLWARTTGPDRLATFFLGRALRIWPVYLAVMATSALFHQRLPSLNEIALLGAASHGAAPLIGTEWSLDIELQFYALLPLLVLTATRLNRATIIVLTLATAWLGVWIEHRFGLVTVMKFLPAFAIGMAISHFRWQPSRRVALGSLVAFAAWVVASALLWENQPATMANVFGPWDDHAIAALWVAPLLPYVAASVAAPSRPADRRIGDLSYPLYLVHLPVIALIEQFWDWRTLSGFAGALTTIALATALLWMMVDRPAEAFRKRLLAGRPFARRYPAVAAR